MVSYQCAIDAVSARCFPSYALRRRSHALGALAQFEYLLVAAADRRGLGGVGARPRGHRRDLGRPPRAGLPRARRHPRGPGLRARSACPPTPRWGCGGTPAAGWPPPGPPRSAAEYAPELNIVGAVLGSPVGDLGHTFRRLNGTFYSGLPATVVAALSHIYPDLDRVIQRARHRRGQGAAGRGSSG